MHWLLTHHRSWVRVHLGEQSPGDVQQTQTRVDAPGDQTGGGLWCHDVIQGTESRQRGTSRHGDDQGVAENKGQRSYQKDTQESSTRHQLWTTSSRHLSKWEVIEMNYMAYWNFMFAYFFTLKINCYWLHMLLLFWLGSFSVWQFSFKSEVHFWLLN